VCIKIRRKIDQFEYSAGCPELMIIKNLSHKSKQYDLVIENYYSEGFIERKKQQFNVYKDYNDVSIYE
jgi:hypothetical protein